jgi:hypothetical protein
MVPLKGKKNLFFQLHVGRLSYSVDYKRDRPLSTALLCCYLQCGNRAVLWSQCCLNTYND